MSAASELQMTTEDSEGERGGLPGLYSRNQIVSTKENSSFILYTIFTKVWLHTKW